MSINISTSEGVFRWKPACWLRVTGEDAFTFLQGQFTNDLGLLSQQAAVYGLWLTLKGKVLADSFLMKETNSAGFWIGSYFSSAAVIRERLESYVIADDVSIEDQTDAWSAATVMTGQNTIPAELSGIAGVMFPGRRGKPGDIECVYPAKSGEPAEITAWSRGLPADRETMERRRIRAGVPAIPIDLGPSDLPNEAGLDAVAISYTKGCYLGQEVMARLKSMGQVRRRLWRVRGSGAEWPALPAAVFAGARQVGELRSAAQEGSSWLGLAMVSLLHVTPGMELSFAADAVPALRLDPVS